MATFKRVIPIGQLAIMRRELEQAGAINIDWTSAGDGHVEVTATMPNEDALVTTLLRVVLRVAPPW